MGKNGEAASEYVGAIICKLARHPKGTRRGYIAMLAVDERWRRLKIGKIMESFQLRYDRKRHFRNAPRLSCD